MRARRHLPLLLVSVSAQASCGRRAARDRRSCRRQAQEISGPWEREQDENERVPNKPMQACRGRTNSSHRQNSSWNAAAVAHPQGILSERSAASATPDELHPPGRGQCRDAATAGKPRQDSSSVRWMSNLWCCAHGFSTVFFRGSTEQRETKPMLTRYRSESAERQWEQCNLSDCIPNPGRINKKPSQEGERDANSRQRVVSVTTSPQRKRLLPRAFPLRCAVTKDTETTRRRRKTGAVGSDIGEGDVQHVADLASTSPDIRLQSKVSGHHQRWRKNTP